MASASVPGLGSGLARETGRKFDGWLLISAVILLGFGLLSLYSIGVVAGEAIFRKQVLYAAIGLVPFGVMFLVRPGFWRRCAPFLYVISLGLLLAVLALGFTAGGAKRWVEVGPIQFQPSEVSKLLTVITLAAFYANRQNMADRVSTFLLSLIHIALPVALLLRQPHLGGALVLLTIWLSISLASGTRLRFIGAALGVVALAGILAWNVPGVLRPYHKDRVAAMFTTDESDADYQVFRAQIAFGVGGVTGSGFLRGEQKEGGFIPEQHNDFILTVLGEEGGLIGCALLLLAYAFFFFRIWLVMLNADEPYHRMIAAGIFGMLAFHTVANMGMVLQLLPVVGLWLPFMSAGVTALWLCMASVGLLLAVRREEKPLLF